MANKEHLKILKQGVEVWNKWRKENPHIKPDLGRADSVRGFLGQVQKPVPLFPNSI